MGRFHRHPVQMENPYLQGEFDKRSRRHHETSGVQGVVNGEGKLYETVELRRSPRLAHAESEEKLQSMHVSEGMQATFPKFRGPSGSESYHRQLQLTSQGASEFNSKRQTGMSEGEKPRRLVSGISSAFVRGMQRSGWRIRATNSPP